MLRPKTPVAYLLTFLEPGFDKGLPSQVDVIVVDHPAAGDGRGRRLRQVLHFKQQGHLFGHGNSLPVDEREHLVVVHDRVHTLDPQRVHRPVKYNPLLIWFVVYEGAKFGSSYIRVSECKRTSGYWKLCTCTGRSHDRGEDSVRPLIGGEVIFAIQFPEAHRFGVERIILWCHERSREWSE